MPCHAALAHRTLRDLPAGTPVGPGVGGAPPRPGRDRLLGRRGRQARWPLIPTARRSGSSPGRGEDPGPGVIGSLAKLIKGQLSASVTREAVAYPAALNGWARSAAKGDRAIKADLTSAARRCPSQVFVLLGYSQGAEIVGDALGGGGGSGLGPVTAGVPASVARKVVAVIQYSDPRRFLACRSTRAPRAAQLAVPAHRGSAAGRVRGEDPVLLRPRRPDLRPRPQPGGALRPHRQVQPDRQPLRAGPPPRGGDQLGLLTRAF